MAEGKWISELTAETPLEDAARRVLRVRLEVVCHHLPLASRDADKDVEHVHQLRVGTRRAGAALDIFRSCLPDKVYAKAGKRMKRIRRAAGEARDWDVFLIALSERERQAAVTHRPGLDFLMGYAVAQRTAAQAHLEDAGPDYPFKLERVLADTVGAVDSRVHSSRGCVLVDVARPIMTSLLKELDDAAARDLEDYHYLHRVRIIGKRLRYAMEIFADCFAPAFREEIYPAVEAMQEILGDANDSHVASQRLTTLREALKMAWPDDWKRLRPGVEGLLRFHQQRLPRERKKFLAWWKRWQASGTEQALADLVKGTAKDSA
jgi:CHAD domain-containing protein